MWLGDQITDRGIGNGMSMIITVGIVARLPAALVQAWKTFVPSGGQASQVNPMVLVLMIAFLVIVIAAVICVTQAQRKITVQYAKRVVGPQGLRRPDAVHAAQGQLPRRHADHLRPGAPHFPAIIVQMTFKQLATAQKIAAMLAQRLAPLCPLRG